MAGKQTNVYIDGFNLYYGALKDRPGCKWLDVATFAQSLLIPGLELHRVRYFTAPVSGRTSPHEPLRQQIYFRALRTSPGLSIHEGQFRVKAKSLPLENNPRRIVRVLNTEEKGSDVNLASYLLLDAFKGDAEAALVISDDFDLREPLLMARREAGLTLGVASPRCRSWLATAVKANFYKPIKESDLLDAQFPASLEDSRGQITRPPTWR